LQLAVRPLVASAPSNQRLKSFSVTDREMTCLTLIGDKRHVAAAEAASFCQTSGGYSSWKTNARTTEDDAVSPMRTASTTVLLCSLTSERQCFSKPASEGKKVTPSRADNREHTTITT